MKDLKTKVIIPTLCGALAVSLYLNLKPGSGLSVSNDAMTWPVDFLALTSQVAEGETVFFGCDKVTHVTRESALISVFRFQNVCPGPDTIRAEAEKWSKGSK